MITVKQSLDDLHCVNCGHEFSFKAALVGWVVCPRCGTTITYELIESAPPKTEVSK
jgi:predicted RNA-binding Zn-ribbon protein involved in translation (DUF1610 family)